MKINRELRNSLHQMLIDSFDMIDWGLLPDFELEDSHVEINHDTLSVGISSMETVLKLLKDIKDV